MLRSSLRVGERKVEKARVGWQNYERFGLWSTTTHGIGLETFIIREWHYTLTYNGSSFQVRRWWIDILSLLFPY